MKNNSLLITIVILIIAMNSTAQETGTFTDSRDGKNYKTVKIGSQTWMAENLNFTTSDSWCYNDSSSNCTTYGRLYTWTGAKSACPSGWHLPDDFEWATLITYLGGENIAGGKLKETGTTHWQSPNTGATNESMFTALPGGYRSHDGTFYSVVGRLGNWWSSTKGGHNAWARCMYYDENTVSRDLSYKTDGFSVRCIKDK